MVIRPDNLGRWGRFNINTPIYQFSYSLYKDKTVSRPIHIHYKNLIPGEVVFILKRGLFFTNQTSVGGILGLVMLDNHIV